MERAGITTSLRDRRMAVTKPAWETFIRKRNACDIAYYPSLTTTTKAPTKKQLQRYQDYIMNSFDLDEISYKAVIISQMQKDPDLFIPEFRYCYFPVSYTPDLPNGAFSRLTPFAVPEGNTITARDWTSSEAVVFRPTLVIEAVERSLGEGEMPSDTITHLFFLRDHTRQDPGFVHVDNRTSDPFFYRFQK